MKLWTGVAFAVSIALIGGGWLVVSRSQSKGHFAQPQTAPEPALVHHSTQFAFNLLKELARPDYPASQRRPTTLQEPSPNVLFSPLSVQFVLALFLNGAEGQTREEIAHALGVQATSLEVVNQFHSELRKALGEQQGGNQLVLANSLWVRPFDQLHPEFGRIGRAFYALETYKVDFSKPLEAARRINAWGKQRTQGFVSAVVRPQEIAPDTILGIANALYWRGWWQQPFKAADYEMAFYLEDGKPVRVRPMEAEWSQVPYGQMEGCEIVGLPYQGGSWVCYVVLPRKGMRLLQLVEQLDAARWEQYLGQLRVAERVKVVLPRFEGVREWNLIPALQRLGIQRAFEGQAEFPRIIQGDGGYIDLFKQVCRAMLVAQ